MSQWSYVGEEQCIWLGRISWSLLSALKCMIAATIFFVAAAPVVSFAQSRADCNKCCQEMFSDEYYAEQCRLKCFRDASHCNSLRAARGSVPRTDQRQERAPADRQVVRPQTPSATKPEVAAPQEPVRHRTEQATPRQPPFVWPETLVLNPGREWEAAGQILAANGIPPQHPNYTPALKAIEQVLVGFARANPGGGDLPTDQLENIIKQARR